MGEEFLRGLTFDDILIRPAASTIEPAHVELETEIVRGLFLTLPFLSAAMDRVTEEKMAIGLGKLGGIGVLHRNCEVKKQIAMVQNVKKKNVLVGAACGPFDISRALLLEDVGADVIVIDCAHGHNMKVVGSAREMKKKLKRAKLVVGNIATKEAALELVTFADAIKVGVGPGSICTTRIVSGVGMPQFSAIYEVAQAVKKYNVPIIADGGIRTSGDVVKALAAGASSVMIGNLFAGVIEAPGRIVRKNGIVYKEYRGMGSRKAMQKRFARDRYLSKSTYAPPEGVEALIRYRGKLSEVIDELSGGVKIGLGYVGAKTILQLQKKAQFVYITKAGVREGQAHNLDYILNN